MADSENSKSTTRQDDEEQVDERKYFQKVLKDVVALNSLLTVAVFIGLSLTPGQVLGATCHPDPKIHKRLVSFEIASFSCFICSGFLAKTVTVFLFIKKNQDRDAKNLHHQWKCLVGLFSSLYVSMVGCLLLLLAMVDVIQIKLGPLSCHSKFSVSTVSVMVVTIGLGLVIYFISVTYTVFTFKPVKKGKGVPV